MSDRNMYVHLFLQGKRLSKEGKIRRIDLKTCQERCKNKKECGWYSYNKSQNLCLHFENCKGLPFSGATVYVSGQSECPLSYKRKRNFWLIFKTVCVSSESEMIACNKNEPIENWNILKFSFSEKATKN